MSGHSKWSSIKRSKGVADAKRGQIFTKVAREIIVAVRQGGSNPEANSRLRLAIQKARDVSMPFDNIDRAIKRGSGEGGGTILTEATFEGYGPGGVAILVDIVSDNRNRTLQEVRHVFSRNGGNLAEAGSVSWVFDQKGTITIEDIDPKQAEEVALMAIDAGAEDVKTDKGLLEIYTVPQSMEAVRKGLEQKGLKVTSAEVAQVPKTMVEADEKVGLQTLKLLDQLEDLDDVQRVFSNADFSDAIMEKYRTTILAGSK